MRDGRQQSWYTLSSKIFSFCNILLFKGYKKQTAFIYFILFCYHMILTLAPFAVTKKKNALQWMRWPVMSL